MHKDKQYIVVKDRYPRISEILNDCCIPGLLGCKDESLCNLLKKLYSKILTVETKSAFTFVDTPSIDMHTNGTVISADITLSQDDTNCLQILSDGLYVACADVGIVVTSVGLDLPSSVFSVTNSPVTTTGTLTGSFIPQTAGTVFAGPPSGIPAIPTFRALTASDLAGAFTFTNALVNVSGVVKLGTNPLIEDTVIDGVDLYDLLIDSANFIVRGVLGNGQTIPAYTDATAFFYPRKAAWRAGIGLGSQWLDANIGLFSSAFGANTTASNDYTMAWGTSTFATQPLATAWGADSMASGSRSTAWGQSTMASEYATTAWGEDTIAAGQYSTAHGFGTETYSYAGTAIGQYNDDTILAPTMFNITNRAFEIGIGLTDGARKNALTVLFNGKVGLATLLPTELLSIGLAGSVAGTMSLAGATSGKVIIQTKAIAGSYTLTLPDTDGNLNEVLTTDGNGILSWTTGGGGGGSYTDEQAQDAIGLFMLDTNTIDSVYVDGAPSFAWNLRYIDSSTINFSDSIAGFTGDVIDDSSTQRIVVRKNSGANIGTRPRLNLIEGANISLAITDDAINNEIDIVITGSGGGGGGYDTIQEEGVALTQRQVLNFIGGGFTAADDAGNVRTNLTLDADLNAIAALTTTGFSARTAADTWALRTVTAGTGISVANGDGVASNPVITNTDLGSTQNIFKNIAVSGQSTVVADNNNDTLTLIAGAGITITTNAANDEVTIINSSIYTNEDAQDAVGNNFIDTNTINSTYTDATPSYSWDVRYQDTATINLSDDASGLKGDVIIGAVDNTQNNVVVWDGTNLKLRQAASLGGGGGSDELVKVSINDTTPGYLNGKLVAGSGITLTENNDGANETFTISSSSVISLSAVGASPNANAATLTGTVLNLQPASGSFPGVISTTTQTMGAGVKTFTSDAFVNTLTVGRGTGNAATNTAFGVDALLNSLSGANFNTAVGYFALKAITNGDLNVAIGYNSGSGLTTGSGNITVGASSGAGLTSGNSNICIGQTAGISMTTAGQNVAVGDSALLLNVIGNSNVAVGGGALFNYTGEISTAIGYNAMFSATTAPQTVAIGYRALFSLISGEKNTSVGVGSMENATTAFQCATIGHDSLLGLTTGWGNCGMGWLAGAANQTGTGNISIGWSAGRTPANGNDNIWIGQSAGYNPGIQLVSATNCIAIGANTWTTASNQAVYGNTSIVDSIMRGVFTLSSYGSGAVTGTAAYTLAVTSAGKVIEISPIVTQYTDEQAQDAIGNFMLDTNTVDAVYVDAAPSFAWNVRYQDSATINLSDNVSGLQADVIIGGIDNTLTQFVMWDGTNLKLRNSGSVGVPISSLLPAVASNNIDNANYPQVWTWNSLTTNHGLQLSSSSITRTNATSVLNVQSSGANSTASKELYAAYFRNINTGTNSTNYALGLEASGGTNNVALTTISGNVGIGTFTPASLFTVGADQFQVASTGITTIGKATGTTGRINLVGTTSGSVGITVGAAAGTWLLTLPNTAGTVDYVLRTDGAGVTSWVPQTGGYTDEMAQDAVGTILIDTSTIDFTYNDASNQISAIVIDNSITDAKIRQSVGLSVIGRSANTTGNVADIVASSDNTVLRRSGTSIGFGTIANAGLVNSSISFATGTTGADVNWGASPVALGATATLNIPDAGSSARGVITTGTQTIAGEKTFTGELITTASRRVKFTPTSADLTLDATHEVVAVSASGANRTITLPTAVGITGRVYTIKKIDSSANTVTIDASSTQTLDSSLTQVLYVQWDWIKIVSDGANWLLI